MFFLSSLSRLVIQCLWFFHAGFRPRAWPEKGAFAPVPVAWAAELAALRQSSPPHRIFGTGAQPRPKAPGHRICSSCHARRDRASSVFVFCFRCRRIATVRDLALQNTAATMTSSLKPGPR